MILDEIKALKTGRRELRNFGLLVGGVFTALGLWFLFRGKPWYAWALVPGVVLTVFGALLPRSLKYPYLAWMSLALVMGFIVSHVILTLFFFLVVTPVGLVARVFGKDFLRLKLDRNTSTYWIPRERPGPKSAHEYEQQF